MQATATLSDNPAIEAERKQLEQRALEELRQWGRMNPVERAFSFKLERAVADLLAFEDRFQLQ